MEEDFNITDSDALIAHMSEEIEAYQFETDNLKRVIHTLQNYSDNLEIQHNTMIHTIKELQDKVNKYEEFEKKIHEFLQEHNLGSQDVFEYVNSLKFTK